MSNTTKEIVDEITEFVDRQNKPKHSGWYVGIAADPKDALFDRHCVDKEKGGWIHRTAENNASARAAESALHDDGFDGGPGGGGASTKSVYAYRKRSYTSED